MAEKGKLDKLEEKITNELENMEDPVILKEKLEALLLIAQIKKFREVDKEMFL